MTLIADAGRHFGGHPQGYEMCRGLKIRVEEGP